LHPSAPGGPEPRDQRRALRAAMRQRRREVPVRERLEAAAALAARLLPELPADGGLVGGYWAVGGELPLHAVQSGLAPSLRWCLPVLHEDGRLRFRAWSPGEPLAGNRFGIPEPAEGPLLEPAALAVALLPLLAFDPRGQRLGQGGGWYDRSFAFRLRSPAGAADAPPPRLIGIAYAWQQVESLAAAPWDVPLDAVATPSAFHRFDR
jgi:5-formyltetrahydrofolate cyclo-ligase